MKKIIIVSLSCVLLFGFSLSVFAAIPTVPPENPKISSIDNIVELLTRIVNWFFLIVMGLAVLMLLFAGLKWITSAGNEESITTARKMLIWALVGIAIALLSKGLVSLIANLVVS